MRFCCGVELSAYWQSRLRVLGGLAGLATLLGAAGTLDWRLDLFSHFLPWYVLPVVAGILLARGVQRGLLLLVLSLQLVWLGAMLYSPAAVLADGGMRLSVSYINGYVNNPSRVSAVTALLADRPDVLLLTEADDEWFAASRPLRSAMPFGCGKRLDTPFGIQLFAREKPLRCEVFALPAGAENRPAIRAELPGGLVIYGVHPPPPLGGELSELRDAALTELARRIAAERGPVLLLGDFNITASSPVYLRFRHQSGLTELGNPLRPTWAPPGWPALLSLDRALGRDVAAQLRVGPALGSDHRLLQLSVTVQRNRKNPT